MRYQQSVVCALFVVMSAAAVGVVGCGNGSEEGSPSGEDTGVITDLPASERCENACDNFMEQCGSFSSASRVQCELGCEHSWSEPVSACVTNAPSCGAIEQCGSAGEASDAGSSGGDAGEAPIPLPPKDAGDGDAEVGDDVGEHEDAITDTEADAELDAQPDGDIAIDGDAEDV